MLESKAEALARLIAILESAKARKRMYFDPIEPRTAIHWLHGLETGASLAGLEWDPEDHCPALTRRGLELMPCWEDERLAARGLGPEAIVDELLSIEIEMWKQAGGRTL